METNLPRFKRAQIIRLTRLLNMMYRPSEIAKEIEVTTEMVVRTYLPAGAPHTRDESGHIWIHGWAFRDWAKTVIGAKRARSKHPMTENQAWCMKCNAVVTILNPKPKKLNRYADLLQGTCAVCGTRVNRAISKRGAETPTGEARSKENEPTQP